MFHVQHPEILPKKKRSTDVTPRLGRFARFAQAIRDPRGGPNDHPRQDGYDLQKRGFVGGRGQKRTCMIINEKSGKFMGH